MNRDQLAKTLGGGDGVTTATFAEIWGCSAAIARKRLHKIDGMVSTPVEGTGKIGGRYSHDVWQLASYEEPGALDTALDAIFPPESKP